MDRQPQLTRLGEACKAPSQLVWGEAEVPLPKGDNQIDIIYAGELLQHEGMDREKEEEAAGEARAQQHRPNLGSDNADGELIHVKWKAFKRARNITSTSMNVLLERPGETYFTEAKQLKSKNKTCAQISLAATEFFKVFLNYKNGFELPYAHTEYKTYNVKSNSFSKWKEGAWAPGCAAKIGLAVVDLRELPGVEDAFLDKKSTPYFYFVMAAFEKRATPLFAEVKK